MVPIIVDIQKANFVISAIQQFHVDPVNAEEFLEVYKGVLPDYAVICLPLSCFDNIIVLDSYSIIVICREWLVNYNLDLALQWR